MGGEPLSRLLAEMEGTGGVLKSVPEDFEVEELPAYLPSDTGEHLFLWVEKVDRDTPNVARQLARGLGLPEREVSYAGLKDRRAVTRQLFSVPAKVESKLAGLSLFGVRIVWARRHSHKLRSGHLRGNRFRLKVRQLKNAAAAEPALRMLAAQGLPNYFGEQRFGVHDDNAEFGRRLLMGERLPVRPDRFLRRLYLSAFQSLLFNRALSARLGQKTWNRALEGDVLRRHDSGGQFVCESAEVEGPRVERFEVSPAGPLFGPQMVESRGEVAKAEAALLASSGVTLRDFERGGDETQGGRRTYRVPLGSDLRWAFEGDILCLEFTLPKGSYATVLLGELMGPDGDAGTESPSGGSSAVAASPGGSSTDGPG